MICIYKRLTTAQKHFIDCQKIFVGLWLNKFSDCYLYERPSLDAHKEFISVPHFKYISGGLQVTAIENEFAELRFGTRVRDLLIRNKKDPNLYVLVSDLSRRRFEDQFFLTIFLGPLMLAYNFLCKTFGRKNKK